MLVCWCCWVAAGSRGTFLLEACRHPGAATPRLGILPAAEPRHVEVTSPWSSSTDSPHFRVLIQVWKLPAGVYVGTAYECGIKMMIYFTYPFIPCFCLLQTMEASWAWISPKEKASFWHNSVQLDVLIKRKGQKSTLWLLFFFFLACAWNPVPLHISCASSESPVKMLWACLCCCDFKYTKRTFGRCHYLLCRPVFPWRPETISQIVSIRSYCI